MSDYTPLESVNNDERPTTMKELSNTGNDYEYLDSSLSPNVELWESHLSYRHARSAVPNSNDLQGHQHQPCPESPYLTPYPAWHPNHIAPNQFIENEIGLLPQHGDQRPRYVEHQQHQQPQEWDSFSPPTQSSQSQQDASAFPRSTWPLLTHLSLQHYQPGLYQDHVGHGQGHQQAGMSNAMQGHQLSGYTSMPSQPMPSYADVARPTGSFSNRVVVPMISSNRADARQSPQGDANLALQYGCNTPLSSGPKRRLRQQPRGSPAQSGIPQNHASSAYLGLSPLQTNTSGLYRPSPVNTGQWLSGVPIAGERTSPIRERGLSGGDGGFGAQNIPSSATRRNDANTCVTCGMVFTTLSDLNHHQRCHQSYEQLKHVCRVCDKRFLYAKDLRRHETTHNAERTIFCPHRTCERSTSGFSRPDHRRRHIQSQHNKKQSQDAASASSSFTIVGQSSATSSWQEPEWQETI